MGRLRAPHGGNLIAEMIRMYEEEDLLPISALNQLIFCRRRCALMLVEGQWADNEHTVLGLLQHNRSHQQETESRGDNRK